MEETDDQRTVTITVAKLKAYEEAVRKRYACAVSAKMAYDALEEAKAGLELARQQESMAIDAELKATAVLHGRD
jgi:16S rRNA U516 pseudouridylate synthase RsuA-like enzyme